MAGFSATMAQPTEEARGAVQVGVTVRQGKSKCKKTFRRFSRVPLECPLRELQNEPPIDMSGLTSKNPLWPAPGSGLESAVAGQKRE